MQTFGYVAMKYIVPILVLLIAAYPVCKLAGKMGHHPFLGLSLHLPGINIVMLYIFAAGKWPIEYECEALLEENSRLKTEIGRSEQDAAADVASSAAEQ